MLKMRTVSYIVFALLLFFGHFTNAAEIPAKTTRVDWRKVSDQQIAQMLFPKEKLYLYPKNFETLPMNAGSLDGVAIFLIKRLVANFDNDPEEELAVLIDYSTGMCTLCNGQAMFAILDKDNEKVRVAWKKEEGLSFFGDGTEISTVKLIHTDKFFELECIYDSTPSGTGTLYSEIEIIRWNGQKFTSIWKHDLEGYGTGARGVVPHDYLARVDFIDARGAKRIKATSLLVTRPDSNEVRQHFKLEEDFVWNEKAQVYQTAKQYELSYEVGKTCVASKETKRYLGEPGLQPRGPEERDCKP
jgi:hypothetical protein